MTTYLRGKALEEVRQNPDSTKARILGAAEEMLAKEGLDAHGLIPERHNAARESLDSENGVAGKGQGETLR
jgi:hypothetical protein